MGVIRGYIRRIASKLKFLAKTIKAGGRILRCAAWRSLGFASLG